ncbi:hypothetical protein C8R47DRAFT_1259774, partial [Mycena vitilis]
APLLTLGPILITIFYLLLILRVWGGIADNLRRIPPRTGIRKKPATQCASPNPLIRLVTPPPHRSAIPNAREPAADIAQDRVEAAQLPAQCYRSKSPSNDRPPSAASSHDASDSTSASASGRRSATRFLGFGEHKECARERRSAGLLTPGCSSGAFSASQPFFPYFSSPFTSVHRFPLPVPLSPPCYTLPSVLRTIPPRLRLHIPRDTVTYHRLHH